MAKELNSKGWSLETVNEILQDSVCFEFILELKRRMNNIESKNYISMFLKLIAPVTVYELADSLEKMGIKRKSEFFNLGMKKRVQIEREKSMKLKIIKSSLSDQIVTQMGLNFEEKVYDMNIIVKDNELLDMNYEIFCEDIKEEFEFWDSLLSIPRTVANILLGSFGYADKIDDMFKMADEKMNIISKALDEELNGQRYSYSVHKLFEHANNFTEIDKKFILYRYRMINTACFFDTQMPKLNMQMEIGNQAFIDFSMNGYFRKYKASIIEIVGKELLEMETTFSTGVLQNLENNIQEKDFFQINRKLRNNLHYVSTYNFSSDEINIIDKYQDIYLMTLIKAILSNINIDVDQECCTMTGFLEDCIKKGISKEELDSRYPYYYLKYCRNTIKL